MSDKIACRTPAAGRNGVTNVPQWKYDAVRQAILAALDAAGSSGVAFADLAEGVAARLDPDLRARLGSVSWHVTTVKLNMEVEGEIRRLPGRGRQRLARADHPGTTG